MTKQTLTAVVVEFGSATGAPKRHPVAVHVRLLEVSLWLRAVSARRWLPGTQLAFMMKVVVSGSVNGCGIVPVPLPKYAAPQERFSSVLPVVLTTDPHAPLPSAV